MPDALWISIAFEQLIRHEGRRNEAYQCPAGRWTIGVGHNIEARGLTIGDELIDLLFHEDVADALKDATVFCKQFNELSPHRQAVLVNMAFQLGLGGLMKFVRFRAALASGDYPLATVEMLNSKWAREDTPARAMELAEIMRRGA